MNDDLEHLGATSVDEARFRQVLGHFCTGVMIVTGIHGGEPVGFTVQAFTSVSLDPPLVAFCVAKTSSSWPRIQAAGAFCANVLDAGQEALSRVFATRGAERFRGVGWRPGPATGAPVLDDVLAWVEGRVEAEHDAGDHTIVVGRVLDLDARMGGRPLLFYRGGFGRFEP